MRIFGLGFNGNGSIGLQRELFVCYFSTGCARATGGGRGGMTSAKPKLFSRFYRFGKASYNNNHGGFVTKIFKSERISDDSNELKFFVSKPSWLPI